MGGTNKYEGAVGSAFSSFFLGGFECSTHRLKTGRRLDLIAATQHDRLVQADFRQLREYGIASVRDGLRWHLIERSPGNYDWSSLLPMLREATSCGMQVTWDLCHYGWPDDLDVWSPAFVDRFARFVRAAATLIAGETDAIPLYCPVNEISFFAWAGGEVGRLNPGACGRGGELKRQLVRATIAAIEAIRDVDPRSRFLLAEPLIHVSGGAGNAQHRRAAEEYRLYQFEAADLLAGRIEPELGGDPSYIDIVGVNFYPDNQWYLGGSTIPLGHHEYRPLAEMLVEAHARYRRPLLIAETGAEGSTRASWLHYVCDEVREAIARGAEIVGICLYPIVDYPGWDNGRICEVGLLSVPDAAGRRRPCARLAQELQRQMEGFRNLTDAKPAPAFEASA